MNVDTAKLLAFSAFPALPLLAPAGFYLGLPWLCAVLVFVGIPLLDLAIGSDPTNTRPPVRSAYATTWLYLIPHAFVATWLGTLYWACNVLSTAELSLATTIGVFASVMIASAFATCAAHELLHRPGRFDRAVARVIMALVAYGHFPTEHRHHHATVGIVRAGTVPLLGESVWSFVLRNVRFSFANSWRIESRRGRVAGPFWTNIYIQQCFLTALAALLFVFVGGLPAAMLFIAQAAFAVFSLEAINYLEHYGLVRREGESASGRLSWSSNCLVTNALTLNITRHAHHHLHPGVPYQDLRHIEGTPLLPQGYFALFFVAMIPPVWRKLMDARVAQISASPSSDSALGRYTTL